tara:strand:+ start:7067 stop:7930 length:864 start_codon:yes stop_codon:yes gene_type:complete
MSSKSGSETTETTLPKWLQDPVQRNLQRAEDMQKLPYMPYRGAEIAAFNPNTIASFNNNNDAARAFGFNAPADAMSGMPAATQYADGSFGYDSNSLYDQALLDSKAYDPVAWDKYQALFDSGAPSANLPIGNPSAGGNGGGGGGNNPIDPNMLAIQKLRDDRANATNPPTPIQNYLDDEQNYDSGYTPPTPTQNYMDDSQNYDSGYTPPTSMQNYLDDSQSYTAPVTNNTPTSTLDTTMPYVPSDDGAFNYGSSLSSRLDSSGYTPTNVSKPIDQIMEEYLAKQAGK